MWKIREDQDIQRDWAKLEKSTYCNYYKGIKESVEIEAYWRRKDLKSWQQETCARWRCGNPLRGGKKGFTKESCRGCKGVTETWEHVINCDRVMQRPSRESKEWWQDWRNKSSEDQWRDRIIKEPKTTADKEICNKLAEVKKVLRKSSETDSEI